MEGLRAVASQTVPLEEAVATEGDPFATIVQAHYQGLARLAYVLCGNPHQAEDAVAEACARVWPKWRDHKIDDLGAYLRRAVINQVRGGLRSQLGEARKNDVKQAYRSRLGRSRTRSVNGTSCGAHCCGSRPASER
jgi:DNA-directed RNA polymerase specialized sigma24 family protein